MAAGRYVSQSVEYVGTGKNRAHNQGKNCKKQLLFGHWPPSCLSVSHTIQYNRPLALNTHSTHRSCTSLGNRISHKLIGAWLTLMTTLLSTTFPGIPRRCSEVYIRTVRWCVWLALMTYAKISCWVTATYYQEWNELTHLDLSEAGFHLLRKSEFKV